MTARASFSRQQERDRKSGVSAQYNFDEGEKAGIHQSRRTSKATSLGNYIQPDDRPRTASRASLVSRGSMTRGTTPPTRANNAEARASSRRSSSLRSRGAELPKGAEERSSNVGERSSLSPLSALASPRLPEKEIGEQPAPPRERPIATPRGAAENSPRATPRGAAENSPRAGKSKPAVVQAIQEERSRIQDSRARSTSSKRSASVGGRPMDACIPCSRGKWVRHDADGFADSKGGTSLKGAIIKKPQDDFGAMTELLRNKCEASHKAEVNSVATKFNGFTDRFIRWQDGAAMKVCIKHEGEDGREHTQDPPGCACPKCKPMRAALMPPAGQVAQVEVGGAGKPPYILQTQGDGIMATIDSLQPRLGGRREFKLCKEEKAEMNEKFRRETIFPRGCEPQEPTPDPCLASANVRSIMSGEGITNDEKFKQMSSFLGVNRRKQENGVPGTRHREVQKKYNVVVYDDYVSPRVGKDYVSRIRATHHFADGGGVNKVLHSEWTRQTPMEKPILRHKGEAEFGPSGKLGLEQMAHEDAANSQTGITVASWKENQGFSEWTTRYCKHMAPHIRYDCGEQLKSRRALSAPPLGDGDGRRAAEEIYGTPLRSPRTPRYRQLVAQSDAINSGAAGISSAGKSTTGTKSYGAMSTHTDTRARMGTCLEHVTNEDVSSAREHRLRQSPTFADKCIEIRNSATTARQIASSIKSRVHHMVSASVATSLQWA